MPEVVERIDYAVLEGRRPRTAGANARLGVHGDRVRVPLVRVKVGEYFGFGWSRAPRERLEHLVGKRMDDLFDGVSVLPDFRFAEFPLLDLLGRVMDKPVYELVGRDRDPKDEVADSFRVCCYDTSLYFDDLHLTSHQDAALLMGEEARQGYESGHRAFKVKVGRGARHMPLEEGMARDVAVVRGIREAVGSDCVIMVDANNGYNLNLAKWFLTQTRDVGIHWIEEAFHEDRELYSDLREWLRKEGIPTLIADGEGEASRSLVDWAIRGLIDVVQYDLRDYGFHNWIDLGVKFDEAGVKSAPHNYGGMYGNFASCHIASAIRQFQFVEWDEAVVPGIDTSAYRIVGGEVWVTRTPGFGLELDHEHFAKSVEETGFSIALGPA